MTEDEEKQNAAWLVITWWAENEGFSMARDERIKTIADFKLKLERYLAGSYPMPPWLPAAMPALIEYLEFAELCTEKASKAATVFEASRILVQGYLTTRVDQLSRGSEWFARTQAMIMDWTLEQRLAAALDDPIAFDIACEIGASFLKEGKSLPPELSNFMADVLERKVLRPRPKKGQKTYVYGQRDLVIQTAIKYGESIGLAPTRNDEAPALSGCDVVAEFLSDRGMFPATFAGVKRIWLARG